MIIDKSPLINSVENKFTVLENINESEDTVISVNGILAIFNDDITDITDNVITVNPHLDIDYDNDVFIVIYEKTS